MEFKNGGNRNSLKRSVIDLVYCKIFIERERKKEMWVEQ